MSLGDENFGKQTAKAVNSIQIEITDPQNHVAGSKKYTDYLVRTKVNTYLDNEFSTIIKLDCII